MNYIKELNEEDNFMTGSKQDDMENESIFVESGVCLNCIKKESHNNSKD